MSKIVTDKLSITEWFAAIGKADAEEMRVEDNAKNARLEALYQVIGLPYERPVKFGAAEYAVNTPPFAQIEGELGSKWCAYRLIPQKPGLEKRRQRGLTVAETDAWFRKQTDLDFADYNLEIMPHFGNSLWSVIFVIKQGSIFGEVIRGAPHQLSQGDATSEAAQFSGDDPGHLNWSNNDLEARAQFAAIVRLLCAPDRVMQDRLVREIGATFYKDNVVGYFEALVNPQGIFYIDYNRKLPHLILDHFVVTSGEAALRGAVAQTGVARGRVQVVTPEQIKAIDFPVGDILVCENTDARYLPLMVKAGAIVTDRGGILSHAAIIARELKKPCLVGTKTATQVLKTGDRVVVDADRGIVSIEILPQL